MTIHNAVNRLGDKISAYFSSGEGCGFYPCSAEDAAIAADSAETRGILFRSEDMVLCFGKPKAVRYSDISQISVVACYESPYEDELLIECSAGQLRINDCALHKPLLKQLIEEIIRISSAHSTDEEANEGWKSPEKIEQEIEQTEELPAKPVPVTVPLDDFDDEPEVNLDELDREQTMNYLIASLNEMNAGRAEEPTAPAAEEPKQPDLPPSPAFTPEPQSDDLYIKASAKLREICESGRLSRGQISDAVKSSLVSTAESYTQITAHAEHIPEIIAPRVSELKKAADRLDEYFALGEDIALRVMFFMLFQMLSYSDRIAETPQTKEALNDFFRRYGTAGVTLSMLDSGI